jgi:hypothetical protein
MLRPVTKGEIITYLQTHLIDLLRTNNTGGKSVPKIWLVRDGSGTLFHTVHINNFDMYAFLDRVIKWKANPQKRLLGGVDLNPVTNRANSEANERCAKESHDILLVSFWPFCC